MRMLLILALVLIPNIAGSGSHYSHFNMSRERVARLVIRNLQLIAIGYGSDYNRVMDVTNTYQDKLKERRAK